MATFTIAPDFSAQLTEQPRVLRAQFGDGYEQRVGDGINIRPARWALRFSARSTAERDALLAFFRADNGITAFDWTPPGGVAGKFVCREWNLTLDNAAVSTITATFDQVFEA